MKTSINLLEIGTDEQLITFLRMPIQRRKANFYRFYSCYAGLSSWEELETPRRLSPFNRCVSASASLTFREESSFQRYFQTLESIDYFYRTSLDFRRKRFTSFTGDPNYPINPFV